MVTGVQGLIAENFPMLYISLNADLVKIVEKVRMDPVDREDK